MNIRKFYNKRKEIILYIVFGSLTAVINISVFWLFTYVFPLEELMSNIISWIFAVFFAFITNRKWVFKASDKQSFLMNAVKFYSGRLLTLLIEELIIFLFITVLSFHALLVKIAAQIIVVTLNYIISKKFVFK